MEIEYITEPISMERVREAARKSFGDFAKAVVDVAKGVMTLGGEMHVDGEQILLKNGSRQEDVWGVNLYPDNPPESFIEYDSMVNIRPRQGVRGRIIENEGIRKPIADVVSRLIHP